MKTELVDVSETRRSLAVEIPTDRVDAELERVTRRYASQARLPGFRPGKVPASVIRKRFRAQIFQDAAEHLIGHAVEDVLNERGLQPLETPDVKDVAIDEGKPLTFTALFDVVPPFDPGDLGTIEATRPSTTVEDAAIDQALERLRDRAARFEPAEATALEMGHTAVMSLVRQGTSSDGTPGEEEKVDQASIEIGAPQNPPGFDAAVVGMTAGESRAFDVTYPADYSNADLAGGTVHYQVTLKDIKRRIVPTLDDDFARDLGEFDSLEALRARVKADLEAEAADASDRQLRNDVLKALAARVPFTVPPSLIDREIDRRLQDFARRLMDQRIDPRQANIDWAAFREAQREPATDSVKSAMVLDAIVQREAITATDDDVDAELQKYAAGTGRTAEAIRARLAADGELPRLVAGLRREKAMQAAMSQARVTTA